MIPEAECPSFRFGSEDSLDEDRVYVFPSLPSLEECQAFCKHKPDNRNIIVIEDGVVIDCYKGSPDEMNNALWDTYALHPQTAPLPLTQRVTRNIPLKVVRTTRIILSMLTRTSYRTEIKAALRSHDQSQRIRILRQIDFVTLELDREQRKAIAFHLGQTLALLEGEECYTKSQVSARTPDLAPMIQREAESDLAQLNIHRDTMLRELSEVYIRTWETLNLFCYISSVKVREWTPYNTQCRGTIIDLKTERCVAFPYEKFFKLDEVDGWQREQLATETLCEVSEKMDGSFVTSFVYDGEIRFACKGNFDVEQAQKAMEIGAKYNLKALDTSRYHFTYEVIYPENRFPGGFAIVDYGTEEALYLTGARERHTHRMLDYEELQPMADAAGLPMPRRFSLTLDDMLEEAARPGWRNFEGWVANFGGKRVKVKTMGYNHINEIANSVKHGSHRILRLYTTYDEARWRDHLAMVPDAFLPTIQAEVTLFHERYDAWEARFRAVCQERSADDTRAFVKYVQQHIAHRFQRVLLRMQQGREYSILLTQLVLHMLLEEGQQRTTLDWPLYI